MRKKLPKYVVLPAGIVGVQWSGKMVSGLYHKDGTLESIWPLSISLTPRTGRARICYRTHLLRGRLSNLAEAYAVLRKDGFDLLSQAAKLPMHCSEDATGCTGIRS